MTDSMKFGPEWLRNMSADSTSFIPGGSGIGGNVTTFNSSGVANSATSPGQQGSVSHTPTPRNMFPEFRYGREEMLSLFDKNCSTPEILPAYKKIFVEKVQCPLALTPSTDEEIIAQGTTMPPTRPVWMQRSPVGLGSATRGIGRGGSVDRGRMRGKSLYHPVYQRPTALCEDDLRATSLKTERGWLERNGSGDSLAGGTNAITTDWNGTPTTSPRKEYSSHTRNMENWRRNRNDDNTTDAGGVPTGDGWRGGSSANSFSNAHRWGRSTSWRDEELTAAANTDAGVYGASGNGGGLPMQRSYSTISTSAGGYVGGNSFIKNSPNGNPYVNRTLPTNNTRKTNWANIGASNSGGVGGGSGVAGGGGEGDDNLPEWAMENPSDSGGTFDANGAFHGTVDDKEQISNKKEQVVNSDREKGNYAVSNNDNSSLLGENAVVNKANSPDTFLTITKDNLADTPVSKGSIVVDTKETNAGDKHKTELVNSSKGVEADLPKQEINVENSDAKNAPYATAASMYFKHDVALPQQHMKYAHHHQSTLDSLKQQQMKQHSLQLHGDFTDRMQEVADDMVEKLIMDDDAAGGITDKDKHAANSVSDNFSSGINERQSATYVSPTIAAILKQSTQQQAVVTAAQTLPSIVGSGVAHKGSYSTGGGLVDHTATMQQHQLQRQLGTGASATGMHSVASPNTADLWYYRDPQMKVQGPFTALEMSEWYRAGYFNENLYVRRVYDTRYHALGDLIKQCQGNMPFTHSHLLDLGANNMNLGNSTPMSQMHDKQQVENNFEQCDELKCDITAAADVLSSAVKSLIGSVDMSHMLNMQLQVLQEQYMRQQEILIMAELAKNEYFQRLTPGERDAIVRQKLQMLGLPEYLTSLTGLSNSLAALNPSAGNQLYDAIADCTKKEHDFVASGQQQQMLDADNFMVNAQQQRQQTQQYNNNPYGSVMNVNNDRLSGGKMDSTDLSNSGLLQEFNLRMFLRGSGGNMGNSQQALQQQHAHELLSNATNPVDFMTEQQMIAAATASQSPIMQMWMPQLGVNAANSTLPQTQMMAGPSSHQQSQHQNNQWVTDGPLVGIPGTVVTAASAAHLAAGGGVGGSSVIQQPKSLWGLASLEHSLQQKPFEQTSDANQFNEQPILQTNDKEATAQQQQFKHVVEQQSINEPSQKFESNKSNNAAQSSAVVGSNKQQSKIEQIEKGANKRNNKQQNQQISLPSSIPSKTNRDENGAVKKGEEAQRRELAEEKRRQKEERKRLQVEQEQRRLQLIEQEKRRLAQEEQERQQQIQAQRRKALLGGTGTASATISSTTTTTTLNAAATTPAVKANKLTSSIAPWSAQTSVAATKTGPCLAEIQKAERRERRADQQRQMELLEKQMRAHQAAAAEANDSMLKWNPSPVPVKNLAEIQAEEAKRLANEQLEMQRRKEQEHQQQHQQQQQQMTGISGSANASSGNFASIWGGGASTKVWGSTTTVGFWEEPVKFGSSTTTAAAVLAAGLSNTTASKQSSQLPKQQQANLKKSSTVSIMQNTTNTPQAAPKSTGNLKHQQQAPKPIKQNPKSDGDKKPNTKNQSNIGTGVASNSSNGNQSGANQKRDDLENEFTNWCTKVLNNMNTKVDVPTFVTFLQDLESPFEVKDYIRVYLGESKEYTDFGKQFLERRSKYKNMQRAQNAHNDDMCKPAPAITPSGNDISENKGKQKKIKKNKMTKLDARILGFSVTAAEGRINVGDRDYADAP